MYDALIIGGGPSGATLGYLLAKAGWSVAIVEKKAFPRQKVCGEFISATTLSLLSRLKLDEEIFSLAGPLIKNVELFAGSNCISSPMPQNKDCCYKWGRALGREYLDTLLLAAAKKAGAIIWQPWSVCDIERNEKNFICNIKAKGQIKYLTAEIIIMAHGSWEKQTWNRKEGRSSNLLAFKAHFTGSKLKSGSMPLLAFPGGYGGIVHTDNDRTSLSCCVSADRLKTIREQYSGLNAGEAVFQHLLKINKGVRECLLSAELEHAWLAVGPLKPGIRNAYENKIFYVGNIAGEAHPIIAEGISMAIQSTWLLSNLLITCKARGTKEWILEAGNEYKLQWKKKFTTRIYAAAFFAKLASNENANSLLLPCIRAFPSILSWGAQLSGKINAI